MAPACIIMPVHRPDYRYAARSLRSMQQYGTDVRMTPVHLIFDIELDLAADGGRMPAVCASGDCVARDSFVRLRSLEGLMSARGEAASASRRLRAALADAGAASGTNLSFYNPKGGKPSWLGTNGSALKASGCMPLFHHYAGVVTWKRKYQALKKWYGAQDAIEAEGCATLWVLDSESYAFRPFSFEADVFGRYRARPALHVGAHRPRDCGATERLLERCAPALFSLSTGIARGWEQRVAVRVDGMVEGATMPTMNAFHDDMWIWEAEVVTDWLGSVRARGGGLSLAEVLLSAGGAFLNEQTSYANFVWMRQRQRDARHQHIALRSLEGTGVSRGGFAAASAVAPAASPCLSLGTAGLVVAASS